MSFDWHAYWRFAEITERNAPTFGDQMLTEAALRSVISRAYYSAFHDCRQQLIRENWKIPRDHTHEFVIDRFHKYMSADAARERNFHKVGIKLERLRDDRADADYDNPFPGTLPNKAKSALRTTTDIAFLLRARP